MAAVVSTTAATDVGREMHELVADLYPLCRSITGDGVRETLRRVAKQVPLGRIAEPRSSVYRLLSSIQDPGDVERFVSDRLGKLLTPLKREDSPFSAGERSPRGAIFVEPELVAEVEFTEWTSAGILRHPSYKGLREDKAAREVVREDLPPPVLDKSASAKRSRKGGPGTARPGRARSTCCGRPSRPGPSPARPRSGPWRSSTSSSR